MLPRVGETGYFLDYDDGHYMMESYTFICCDPFLDFVEVKKNDMNYWLPKAKFFDLPDAAIRAEKDRLNRLKRSINKGLKRLAEFESQC